MKNKKQDPYNVQLADLAIQLADLANELGGNIDKLVKAMGI